MPINRVHDAKIKLYWHQLLQEQDAADGNREASDALLKPKAVPRFIPGLLLFPIPKAGPISGYIDMAFWAETSFVFGSILYLVDSFFLWHIFKLESHDDASTPGATFNMAATAVFILNGIWCFVDWWLQYKQLSFLSLDIKEEYQEEGSAPVYLPKFSNLASVFYGCNNFFFLMSAIVFLIQGIWWEDESTDIYGCYETTCGSFWINFWGTVLQLLSGIFALLEYWLDCKKRRRRGLKPLKLLTVEFERFDWFGWGDLLYFIASFIGFFEVFDEVYINQNDDNAPNAIYFASNFLFLVDSIIYLAGHIFYMLELRNALKTGFLTQEQVAIINSVMQENLIEDDQQDGASGGGGSGSGAAYIDEKKHFGKGPRRLDIVNTSMTIADAKIAYREYLFERRTLSTSAIVSPFMSSSRLSSFASSSRSIASKAESLHLLRQDEEDFDTISGSGGGGHKRSSSFAEGTMTQKQDFSSTVSELIGSYTGSHGSYKSNMDSYMERVVSGSAGTKNGSDVTVTLTSSANRIRASSINNNNSGTKVRGNSINSSNNTPTSNSVSSNIDSSSNINSNIDDSNAISNSSSSSSSSSDSYSSGYGGVYKSLNRGSLSEQLNSSPVRNKRPFQVQVPPNTSLSEGVVVVTNCNNYTNTTGTGTGSSLIELGESSSSGNCNISSSIRQDNYDGADNNDEGGDNSKDSDPLL